MYERDRYPRCSLADGGSSGNWKSCCIYIVDDYGHSGWCEQDGELVCDAVAGRLAAVMSSPTSGNAGGAGVVLRGLFKPGVSVLANCTLSTGAVPVTTFLMNTVTAGGVSKTASLSVTR